jgi:hypothetical protein
MKGRPVVPIPSRNPRGKIAVLNMPSHKFKVGDIVALKPAPSLNVQGGVYETAKGGAASVHPIERGKAGLCGGHNNIPGQLGRRVVLVEDRHAWRHCVLSGIGLTGYLLCRYGRARSRMNSSI